ncbi:MAG: DUF4124 domain-containing protein [Nitrospinae bacterium]|nr:DUF4124 domain-containing protein [Nitrospinota bacterium]
MKTGTYFAVIVALAAALASNSLPANAQSIYKWVDEQGVTHFGNDPYKAPKTATKEKAVYNGDVPEAEEAPAAETKPQEPAANGAKDRAKGGLEVVGNAIEILNSETGLAIVKASVKNNFDYPVEGVRLDVVIYQPDGAKLEPLSIPYEGGAPKGKLKAAEIGAIEREINMRPEDVAGYEFQVVWAFFESTGKPAEGQSGDNVFHKVVPKGKKGEPAPAAEAGKPGEQKTPPKTEQAKEEKKEPSRLLKRILEKRQKDAEAAKAAKPSE